jgi:dihydrofolate reductase
VARDLALIAAVGPGGVIGRAGALPWHLPEDLGRFKALTLGHALVMGRTTHQSIGRPLPGRTNVVVSRTPGAAFPGCEVVPTLALALARVAADPLPFVIGGASLYAEALPLATHLYLTEVSFPAEGDVFFPPFDRRAWQEVRREAAKTAGVHFVDLLRRPGYQG